MLGGGGVLGAVGQEIGRGGRENLIKTEYWDRAGGGGGNISYDWCGTSRIIHALMALDKVKSACK